MNEVDSRLLATGIIERLRARGEQPINITIWPTCSGVIAQVGFMDALVVEARIPQGFFSYDRIADDLCRQVKNAVIDSDS
jgi:hypothetical protein